MRVLQFYNYGKIQTHRHYLLISSSLSNCYQAITLNYAVCYPAITTLLLRCNRKLLLRDFWQCGEQKTKKQKQIKAIKLCIEHYIMISNFAYLHIAFYAHFK